MTPSIPVDPRQQLKVQKLMITHNRGSPHNENYLRQKSKGPQTDFQTDVRKYRSQYEFLDCSSFGEFDMHSSPICLGTKSLFDKIAIRVYKSLNTLLNNWSLQPKS